MSWRRCYPLLKPRRLDAEVAVMAKAYPSFRLTEEGGLLAFRGRLRSNHSSEFVVEIRLPPRFPEVEPHLWVLSPALPERSRHRYVGGRLCAHAQPFVPYRTTAAAMVSVLAGWLFRFERDRLEGVPWEAPLGTDGETVYVRPDGSLWLARR